MIPTIYAHASSEKSLLDLDHPGEIGKTFLASVVIAVLLTAIILRILRMKAGKTGSKQGSMDRKNRLVMVIIFTILIFLSLLESQVFSDKSESTEQQPITNISTIAPSAIVELTAKGDYQPKSVRIKRGQAVRFVNQSQSLMWPASDPHPSHKDYPGFDPRQIIHPGENWQFTFERTGTFGYHDHLNPMRRGQIVVTD